MNCVIIDDDTLSRRVIEEYVKKTNFLSLIHSFSNAVDAINNIKEHERVDLVFLDIEMPEMSGIDFLNTLNSPCQIVIISSKEKYALEAFEYNVTDYLLKPILYSRFFKAVEKAHARYDKMQDFKEGDNEVFIKKNAKLVRVRYDEILWIEALENYVMIAAIDENYTIHFTMKAIESKLPKHVFVRIHRSYIVNKSKIAVIEDNSIGLKANNGEIKMLPIGKSYRNKLLGDINLIFK